MSGSEHRFFRPESSAAAIKRRLASNGRTQPEEGSVDKIGWFEAAQYLVGAGHREADIWEYPYGKFRRYLDAIANIEKRKVRLSFELDLGAARGTEDSVKQIRRTFS